MQGNNEIEEQEEVNKDAENNMESLKPPGQKFNLADSMINKKHLQKARDDIKKVKHILSEMQGYVQQHEITIKQEMVNEDKLKITFELLESQIKERSQRELQYLMDTIKPKIKKRIKEKDVDKKIIGKVNKIEFLKHIERLDDNVRILGDKVDYQLPALKYEVYRDMKNKADMETVMGLVDSKVEKEFIDQLIERINKIEEMAAAKIVQAQKPEEESEDEVVEEKEAGSPDSIAKKKKKKGEVDSEEEAKAEELRKQAEEAQKAMQEMIKKLQTQISTSVEELRKSIDDQRFEFKRIEQEIENLKKQQKAALQTAQVQSNDYGGDKISGAQQIFNDSIRERLDTVDRELERLLRVDFRLNKELVQKPYLYIDKVKDALDKEQKDIISIIKTNNDKYIQKIGQMDQKVNKVLTDTETLIDQYKKKISDITKNLDSIKKFKEQINIQISQIQKYQDNVSMNCDQNHLNMSQHIDRISLKFAETTTDLNSSNQGFEREIERVQILFRELQQEFLTQLEEKRLHNEALLRGAGIEELDLQKAMKYAKEASDKNLSNLLPKLKKTHLESNIMLTGRQEKIMAILKGDKISPQLNQATSRKFFRNPSDMQSTIGGGVGAGIDLATVNSHKFMPGRAFMTGIQTPSKTNRVQSINTFHQRKNTQNPSLPLLDLANKQDQDSRYKNQSSILQKKNQSVTHKDSATHINLTSQKKFKNNDGSIQNLLANGLIAGDAKSIVSPQAQLGEDFAKIHVSIQNN